MNIAVFGTLTALMFALKNRKEQASNKKNVAKPVYPALNDRIISMYPINFVTSNDVLGGFSLACNRIFPQSRNIGYSVYKSNISALNNFIVKELEEKFPNVEKINADSYQFVSADVSFHKVSLYKAKKVALGKLVDKNPESNQSFLDFIKVFTFSKSTDVIIEVKHNRLTTIDEIIDIFSKNSRRFRTLKDKGNIYYDYIDACTFSGQKDVRLYITTFPIAKYKERLTSKRIDSFVYNLDPTTKIKSQIPKLDYLNKILQSQQKNKGNHSYTHVNDQLNTCAKRMSPNPLTRPYLLEDFRLNTKYPLIRNFSVNELERLAGYPTDWISQKTHGSAGQALSISSNPIVLEFILSCYAVNYFNKFEPGIYYG